MKYTQYSRKRSGSSAFYIVIALCLVVIGVIAWFAFKAMQNNDNTMQRDTSSVKSEFESKIDEFSSDFNSYIESEPSTPSQMPGNNSSANTPAKNEHPTSTETEKIKAYSMPVNGEILKDFSTKALQYSATFNDMRMHAAVDIAALEGTMVSACCDGIVKEVEASSDFGKTVTVDHGDGLVIKYCGLKNVTAEKDTPVKMGDSLGAVGTIPSECADQSHLHLEAYQNGKAISILSFFD